MEAEEADIIISRHERLRIPRKLSTGRVTQLKAFKTRISDWAIPSDTVFEEPIIVCIKAKRSKRIDGQYEWREERCFDHFHVDVVRFEGLVERMRGAGYSVSVKHAVLAYMLVFKRGQKSVITGFLKTFPQWRNITVSTVGQAISRLVAEGLIRG